MVDFDEGSSRSFSSSSPLPWIQGFREGQRGRHPRVVLSHADLRVEALGSSDCEDEARAIGRGSVAAGAIGGEGREGEAGEAKRRRARGEEGERRRLERERHEDELFGCTAKKHL